MARTKETELRRWRSGLDNVRAALSHTRRRPQDRLVLSMRRLVRWNPVAKSGISLIPDAGNGLFARSPLKAGDLIDTYEGDPVYTQVSGVCDGSYSHVVRLPGSIFGVDGLTRVTDRDADGNLKNRWGLAALANSQPRRLCNARFVFVATTEEPTFMLPVLVAKRDIQAGEEVYVYYGVKDY